MLEFCFSVRVWCCYQMLGLVVKVKVSIRYGDMEIKVKDHFIGCRQHEKAEGFLFLSLGEPEVLPWRFPKDLSLSWRVCLISVARLWTFFNQLSF